MLVIPAQLCRNSIDEIVSPQIGKCPKYECPPICVDNIKNIAKPRNASILISLSFSSNVCAFIRIVCCLEIRFTKNVKCVERDKAQDS